jgi:NhaP-type Na+/H+ or K+/H+ antiporter
MAWGTALVLGAIVSSTDEVAFGPIVERVRLPRHVLATIENESLINDATSLVLYGIGITAVVSGTFSAPNASASLALSIVGGSAVGVAAGFVGVGAWRLTRAVLATVAAGFTVAPYIPKVLVPATRIRISGFWVTIVFVLNAFIFVYAGMQFRTILASLHMPTLLALVYGAAVAATCVVVRLLWVFVQGLIPETNYPQHAKGKADWSHVAVLAWSGMRGGISLAAALAIPLETMAGPFPQRDLIIFLTFCTMFGTLVVQGGTLPLLIKWLNVRDDGTDIREERLALSHISKAALARLEELAKRDRIPPQLYETLKIRFTARLAEFSTLAGDRSLAKASDQYRHLTNDLLMAQRSELNSLAKQRKIDNTVMRRILRLLDFEAEEIAILEMTGHSDLDEDESSDSS